ncbi:LLM class flavin-dependent oxidoreductase [Arthrobacter sp. SD76]|uniref:LLM class flavin-dependent oxidoreductase n=1 Tax=Arthrobacter sp. SD76 TaxID=3415007 RepID=UPI003C76E09E
MTEKKLILGLALHDGSGALNNAWRAPQVNPENYANFEANIRYAQAAERGKFAFLFIPDFPAVRGDIEHGGVRNIIDPMIALTAISQATSRIGFVATGSTSFQEPFNHARQFKALDVLSHGRAGWNAVTTSDPAVAANYGKPVAERSERYQRAHESIQIVQALWGSWQKEAWIKNQASGQYIDSSKLQPVNLQGKYVASRGPLAIPPSEQGQPVIFSSGGPSPHLLALAGRYASGFIGEVWTIEDGRAQRAMVRRAAEEAGRDPDDIKFFAGIMPTVARVFARASTVESRSLETLSKHRYPSWLTCWEYRSTADDSMSLSPPSSSPELTRHGIHAPVSPWTSPARAGLSATSSPTASSTTTPPW